MANEDEVRATLARIGEDDEAMEQRPLAVVLALAKETIGLCRRPEIRSALFAAGLEERHLDELERVEQAAFVAHVHCSLLKQTLPDRLRDEHMAPAVFQRRRLLLAARWALRDHPQALAELAEIGDVDEPTHLANDLAAMADLLRRWARQFDAEPGFDLRRETLEADRLAAEVLSAKDADPLDDGALDRAVAKLHRARRELELHLRRIRIKAREAFADSPALRERFDTLRFLRTNLSI